eukprot:g23075.t1
MRNGLLSTGEWAAGLSVYFKGSMEEAVRAVFSCLDANGDGAISKSELQVYLSPFVKAMSPQEAAALRPLLEKKAVDDIYYDMDMDHAADISSDEMLAWSKRGLQGQYQNDHAPTFTSRQLQKTTMPVLCH